MNAGQSGAADAAQLGRIGLTRVFVLDGRGEILSYGDLELTA